MEPFKITVDSQEYTARPMEEIDQVLYEIYDEDLLCVIGLNEDAQWEANNETSEELVRKLGDAIEQHDA